MTVQLLHYRGWQGSFHSPLWSVWPIARVALGQLFRRRTFWFLYAAGLLLFLMFFFGAFLLDWVEAQVTTGQVQFGTLSTERIVRSIRQALSAINGSQETFGYFFVYQGLIVMIVLAFAGSVLVGNDYTFRSLPFYLSKPISSWHYLMGKGLAICVIVHMLTTVPAVLLFVQHGFADLDYFVNPDYFTAANTGRGPAGWPLLLGILAYGLLLNVFLSIVLLAAATWMRRTMPLVLVWASLFLFLRVVANLLVSGLQYNVRWRLIDLWNCLSLLGRWCLGFAHERISPRPQPAFWEAAVVLGGVCILCLIYLHRRTQAVEIVR